MPPLHPGRIFWAVFPEKRGDGKTRPMVAVNSRTDIVRTGVVAAIVCSTSFARPLLADEVELPSDPEGRSITRLREATVAVCNWRAEIPHASIDQIGGIIPTASLREICRKANIPYASQR